MSSNENSKNNVSKIYFYTFILLMIVTGSINTIANKLQNISFSLGEKYNHPYFVTFLMFLGESFCLIIYIFQKKNTNENLVSNNNSNNVDRNNDYNDIQERENLVEISPNQERPTSHNLEINNTEKPEATPLMLILPALCDFFASTIMTIGLTMLAGSIYQMMRGSSILFTALFSKIFLKNKLYLHHWVSLTIVISGLTLVGAANVIIKPKVPAQCSANVEDDSTATGYIFVIIAQIFVAMQFIIEEKFMKNYTCHPLKAVGWEGVWGSSIYIILLIIFQNIRCPNPVEGQNSWTTAVCTKNDINEYRIEDSIFALRQIGGSAMLLFYSILFVISIAVFNFVGITVTKIASSAARAVIDTIRTVIIWAFFILPIVGVCFREHFNYIQLIGFVFLIFGNLIYNEILVFSFLGSSKEADNDGLEKNQNIENNNLQEEIKNEKFNENKILISSNTEYAERNH